MQPERGTCVFIQHSILNSIGLRLNRLWKACTTEDSQVFMNCVSSFIPVQAWGFFFHTADELVFWFFQLPQPLSVHSINILVDMGKYGHSLNSDCSENLNYDLLGHRGDPAKFVTMNLSLGNIAGLWRNFPPYIFSLMHY